MFAHDAVYGRLIADGRQLMQRRDVAEADDGFGDSRYAIDDTL